MNLTQMKNTVLAVLAAAGSAVAQALGGWDVALKVLICFMALDYVTGWLVAAVCLFFIANEGLSVLENTAVMGVPYPAFVKNMLEALHQTGDQGKGTEART